MDLHWNKELGSMLCPRDPQKKSNHSIVFGKAQGSCESTKHLMFVDKHQALHDDGVTHGFSTDNKHYVVLIVTQGSSTSTKLKMTPGVAQGSCASTKRPTVL